MLFNLVANLNNTEKLVSTIEHPQEEIEAAMHITK